MTRAFPDLAALRSATRLSTSLRLQRLPLLACAIGERPPLARPRPRELVVRLEEDLAHAFLGQAPPDDFCNTTRRAGTPFEHSIPVRELREAAAFFSPLLAQRRRTHVAHRASPLSRGAPHELSPALDSLGENEPCELQRLSPPQPARAEGARAKDSPFDGRAPLLERSLEHPGRRIFASGGLETPPLGEDTAEVPFRRRPAKGDGFRKTEVLCSASEPIEPPCWRRLDFLERAARLLPRTTPRIGPVSRRPSRFRDYRGIAPEGRAFFSVAIGASP